jgi:hypothetical protein
MEEHVLTESEKLLFSIDKKIGILCIEIKHMRDDMDEFKREMAKMKDKTDQNINEFYATCKAKHLLVDEKIADKTPKSFISNVMVFIFALIVGSYAYTTGSFIWTNTIKEKLELKIENCLIERYKIDELKIEK